jgi:uncharacterized protein YjdB/alpha-tubulin suppressor-like RCC1 family protein
MPRIVFVSRAMRLVRFLAFIALAAQTVHAQSISVGAGDSARVVVAPGARLAVPVRVDLSSAAPLTLASLQADVRWNSARLTFDSIRVVASTGFSQNANTASAGTGLVTFNAFSTSALSSSGAITTLYFTAGATSGATRLSLTPTEGGAEDGTNVLARLIPRGLDVCVASQAKWGDVNDDGNVSIIDAQQIARFSVGLSVANVDAVRGRGDVNADANVSIIDAQQIARFSVALSSSARTNTAIAQVPPVQTLAIVTPGAVRVGQGAALSATALDSTGVSVAGCAPVSWSSSSPAVATIRSDGVLTALSQGSTTITAVSGARSATALVTVGLLPVSSISVAPATPSLLVGQTATLAATARDSTGVILTGRVVSWSSANAAIASVSSNGVVSAISAGSTTITASSEGVTATAAVTVGSVPVASVSVTSGSTNLFPGQTTQLTATARDSAGGALAGRVVTWSTSNAAVTVVTANGVVTALAAGSATITATVEGLSASATIAVSVVPVASVTVTPGTASIATGVSAQLAAMPRDSSGGALAGRTVVWSSANPAVATVSSSGVVTGIAIGTVTISAASEGRTGTAGITVTPVPVTSVTVSPISPSLSVGQTTQLTATTRAADGSTLSGRLVTWSSSNPAVASVSSAGLITAVGVGTATITASSEGTSGAATAGVLLPVTALTLMAGNEHTCALVTGGNAYCWGANSSGQLGIGTTSAESQLRPRAVSSSSNARIESFTALSTSGKSNTTCGLLNTGAGFCWGSNQWGNVGDGSTTDRPSPRTVNGALSFARISTGWTHSCGVTRTGVGYCWGFNTVGQLGDGSLTQRNSPTLVSGALVFRQISAGYNSSCGVTVTGDLYCWGDDPLGDGTATPSVVPVRIGSGRSYAAVVTGFRNACALTPVGQAWCWGLARANGQLGNGTTADQLEPAAVSSGLAFTTLAKGEDHTCGLTGTGAIYCWGSNGYGQLGDGTVVGRAVPTLVSGGATYTALAAGAFHTCGATTTGVANCWGRNTNGQLGDGTTTLRLTPTPWSP